MADTTPGELPLEGVNRSCQAHREAAPLSLSSPTVMAGSLPAMAVTGGHPRQQQGQMMGHGYSQDGGNESNTLVQWQDGGAMSQVEKGGRDHCELARSDHTLVQRHIACGVGEGNLKGDAILEYVLPNSGSSRAGNSNGHAPNACGVYAITCPAGTVTCPAGNAVQAEPGTGTATVVPHAPPLTYFGWGPPELGRDTIVVPHSSPAAFLGGGSQASGKGESGVNEDGYLTFNNDGSEVVGAASSADDAFINNGSNCVKKVAPSSAAGGHISKEGKNGFEMIASSHPASKGLTVAEGVSEYKLMASSSDGDANREGENKSAQVGSTPTGGACRTVEQDGMGVRNLNRTKVSEVANEDGGKEMLDGGDFISRTPVSSREGSLRLAGEEVQDSGDDGTTLRSFINDGGHPLNKVASSSAAGGVYIKESCDDTKHAKVKCMGKYRIMVKGPTRCGQTCCMGTS